MDVLVVYPCVLKLISVALCIMFAAIFGFEKYVSIA